MWHEDPNVVPQSQALRGKSRSQYSSYPERAPINDQPLRREYDLERLDYTPFGEKERVMFSTMTGLDTLTFVLKEKNQVAGDGVAGGWVASMVSCLEAGAVRP